MPSLWPVPHAYPLSGILNDQRIVWATSTRHPSASASQPRNRRLRQQGCNSGCSSPPCDAVQGRPVRTLVQAEPIRTSVTRPANAVWVHAHPGFSPARRSRRRCYLGAAASAAAVCNSPRRGFRRLTPASQVERKEQDRQDETAERPGGRCLHLDIATCKDHRTTPLSWNILILGLCIHPISSRLLPVLAPLSVSRDMHGMILGGLSSGQATSHVTARESGSTVN